MQLLSGLVYQVWRVLESSRLFTCQASLKTRYCGHLYSSLLHKQTWWDHRAQLSLYKESVKTTLSPVQYHCAFSHLLLAILTLLSTQCSTPFYKVSLDLVCCTLCCTTPLSSAGSKSKHRCDLSPPPQQKQKWQGYSDTRSTSSPGMCYFFLYGTN